jgi:Rieske Fe-S protein
MNDLLSRRGVIKTILVTTATSLIGNKAWAAKTVSEVAASIDPNVGIAKIVLSAFPALVNNGGSVRLGSSSLTSQGAEGGINVTPNGLYYPIVISRISATEYVAVDTQCTHAGSVVSACVGGLSGRMTCPFHGSQYDIRGKVQPGSEANFDLLSYQTGLADGILSVRLPDFGFTVTQTGVLNGSQKRLQLSWRTVSATEYEVRWRPNLESIPLVEPHSATLSGAVTANTFTSPFTGGVRSVYVLPKDGIYQIAIKQRTV